MDQTEDLSSNRLADAWAELQAHAQSGNPLEADAYRLAFADPEFLLRREVRGIRMQLEMLKPAKISTGFEIGVPIFVAQGDVVEIDTRTGEYRKRV